MYWVVKFWDGTYKTQFKHGKEYGKTKQINHAKFYSSKKTALENTPILNDDIFDVVPVSIEEVYIEPVIPKSFDDGWFTIWTCPECGERWVENKPGEHSEKCPNCGLHFEWDRVERVRR